MMNNNSHSISKRQGIGVAFLLAFALMLAQPDKALSQWVINGNNINNTNTGNVGIGTTTPASKLEVFGNIALSPNSRITSTWDWSNAIMPYESFTGRMALRTGGIDRLSILYGGNVGIGTTFPSAPLEIYKIADGATLFKIIDGSIDALTSAPKMVFSASGTDIANLQASYNSGTFRLDLGATSTARSISILSSGNVGIGTTTPASKLEVIGNIALSPNSRITSLSDWGNAFMPYESFTGRMAFRTAGIDRVNILYNGNIGIGTTGPAAKLDVAGDTNVTGNLTVVGTGNITANGTISGGNIVAKYQDIAEWVLTRQTLTSGTVVMLDVENTNQVIASFQAYDTRVAGVTANPGVILGEGGKGKVVVATTGRVRVKVDATRAPVRVGDLLVTSDKEGMAMRSEPLSLGGTPIHRPGTLIGKALEPLDKGVGEILVLLSLQ